MTFYIMYFIKHINFTQKFDAKYKSFKTNFKIRTRIDLYGIKKYI